MKPIVINQSFGFAITHLKKGGLVAREGWNGKGMYLQLVTPSEDLDMDAMYVGYQRERVETLPWIGMRTADGKFVPWLASQTDILAEDWVSY